MKISYEWLREYVPTKIKAKNLAQKLTMNGLEVTSIEEKAGDFIFGIEVTPNRSDCLCHVGIAREASAITKKRLKLPSFNLAPYFAKGVPIPEVVLRKAKLCPRYTARLIADVKVAPSPKWLIKRIESVGVRPVNNIVDITNFILHETGQPLHAFDYDKLIANKIIIRLAKDGEEITTIDGTKVRLKGDILVIADAKTPVAIAGIMGGLNTEVGPSTKRILLEAACFDPTSIRRSSRYLGLSSDSSYRFERGIDSSKIIDASDRATCLICEIAKGKTHREKVDVGKKEIKTRVINLRPHKVKLLLGAKISNSDIKSGLAPIGFKVSGAKGTMKVVVPSFRRADIKREADLIEEIARIYGYDNIPTKLPRVVITEEAPSFKRRKRITNLVRKALAGLGFDEILTYSLISKNDIRKLNVPDINTISIRNPLSDQQGVMRNTLLPGMLGAINYNINTGNPDIKLFEFSNIYFRQDGDYQESPSLALALCGNTAGDWKRKPQRTDIFYLKGILKTLFEKLGIDIYFEESQHPSFEPDGTMAILVDNKMLGIVGVVKTEILAKTDIKTQVFAAEINTRVLFENARLEKFLKTIIRYPISERDVSMSVNNDIPFESINRAIKDTARFIIKEVRLVEEYKARPVPEGQRGLLVRITYQSKDRTLKEQEIETAQDLIRKKLTQEFNAAIR
ncbi:MAG: phenylalanine--tRNA ligase subunit beta [Candidatus Omnitrophota bacterium]|nr:MAG: phenylalanine--tRNA ligase subunit beta [Candidatus Omnitrophota bacterium]